MKHRILLIEDDPSTASALYKVLSAEDYQVELAARGDEGLALAHAQPFDLILTDFRLPGLSGLELVDRLHQLHPKLPIIMMTAHGTTETAIEATKLGACEYLIKPFEVDELLDLLTDTINRSRLMTSPVVCDGLQEHPHEMIGRSRVMQLLYKEIGRVAASSATVLIRGATGTGKELVARAIYNHSNRADRPFIAVNCAAIPDTLLESELFGHERGAFTGAQNRRIGRFEQAQGGTLFLDEVGDLHPTTQSKLLRVLQERVIQRLGGDATIPVDVRILAATHRDLEAAIQEREFREDLYYRLSVVTLTVPPLCERSEDIPDLVRFFLRKYASDMGMVEPAIQNDALVFLKAQPWPGNVRELENVIRQVLLLARPFAIGLEHVREALKRPRKNRADLFPGYTEYIGELLDQVQSGEIQNARDRLIEELEPELFTQAIARAQGNQARAARWLGITRLKMRETLARLGLHPRQGGGDDASRLG